MNTDRLAAERWFLRHGLPYVLRPGVLLRGVWSRSAPALAGLAVLAANSILIVAVTGKHTIDIDGTPTRTDWFILAMIVLVLPAAATVGWAVSRLVHARLRAAVSAISVAVLLFSALFGGPSVFIHVNVFLDVAALVIIFACTATGVGAILGWATRMTCANLASIGTLLVHALPVMLLTVLVFFNGPVWTMAATVKRGRLWLALFFLTAIASTFLVSSTMSRVRPLLQPDAKRTGDADELAGTPFQHMPDRPQRVPLSRAERINVTFVLALSQVVQVLTVAVATGLLFFVFGLILISPELLSAWTNGSPGDGQILGMTLPVPQALIQISMFLTALTFMYLAARAVSDKQYRAEFLDPLIEDLRVTLTARDRYRTSTVTR